MIEEEISTEIYRKKGQLRTYILQQYIDRPFLYKKRKFDIRCFMLLSRINGNFKGYWYGEGYIRTSSAIFNIYDEDLFVHLTNDAV
jgi:tubulin monoglycylase TTLL3/8